MSQIEELGDLPDGAVVAVLHSEVTRAAATGFAAALGRRTSISAITVPIRSGRPKELVDLLIREHGALRPIVIAYFDYDRAFSGVLELAECLEKTNATVTLRTIDSCARLLLMGLGIALGGLIWHDDHYSR